MQEVLDQLLGYLRGIWRHRWWIPAVAAPLCIAGWIAVFFMPNRFEASARVYVDTQSVLKPLLQGLTVQPNLDQQIGMMTRTLLSRPNLEKVARMTDLDLKAKTPKDMEQLLDSLSREIKMSGSGRDNLYALTYEHQDPDLAKRVVQSLLTIFVESSLGTKRKDTDSALRFIDSQLKAYADKLAASEDALKEFKRKNLGALPGEGANYFDRVSSASGELSQAKLALRELENRRDELKRQLAGEEPVFLMDSAPGEAPPSSASAPASVNPALKERRNTLEKQLDTLRMRFTEGHPDVVILKRLIAQIDQEIEEDRKLAEERRAREAKARKAAGVAAPSTKPLNQNPVYQALSVALAETEANVASMRTRVSEFESRYATLKAAADAQPQLEAEYNRLQREFEVSKKNFEQMLSRRETAVMTGEMEAKTDVVDFRVVDPPRVPTKPSSPNRPLLMSLVLVAAIGIGIGLAFLISQIKAPVDSRRALTDMTGIPVLGSVGMIWSPDQLRRRRRGLVAYLASCASLLGAYGIVLGVTFWLGRA